MVSVRSSFFSNVFFWTGGLNFCCLKTDSREGFRLRTGTCFYKTSHSSVKNQFNAFLLLLPLSLFFSCDFRFRWRKTTSLSLSRFTRAYVIKLWLLSVISIFLRRKINATFAAVCDFQIMKQRRNGGLTIMAMNVMQRGGGSFWPGQLLLFGWSKKWLGQGTWGFGQGNKPKIGYYNMWATIPSELQCLKVGCSKEFLVINRGRTIRNR